LNTPALNELMKRVDSKYTLIIVTAKRARQIIAANPIGAQTGAIKPVSLALKDITAGKVAWHRKQD